MFKEFISPFKFNEPFPCLGKTPTKGQEPEPFSINEIVAREEGAGSDECYSVTKG